VYCIVCILYKLFAVHPFLSIGRSMVLLSDVHPSVQSLPPLDFCNLIYPHEGNWSKNRKAFRSDAKADGQFH
jgi:hypothetical protein